MHSFQKLLRLARMIIIPYYIKFVKSFMKIDKPHPSECGLLLFYAL